MNETVLSPSGAFVEVNGCHDCPHAIPGKIKKTLHGRRYISHKCELLNTGISKYLQKEIFPGNCPLIEE